MFSVASGETWASVYKQQKLKVSHYSLVNNQHSENNIVSIFVLLPPPHSNVSMLASKRFLNYSDLQCGHKLKQPHRCIECLFQWRHKVLKYIREQLKKCVTTATLGSSFQLKEVVPVWFCMAQVWEIDTKPIKIRFILCKFVSFIPFIAKI